MSRMAKQTDLLGVMTQIGFGALLGYTILLEGLKLNKKDLLVKYAKCNFAYY